MKEFNIIAAFLGGAALGLIIGILLAPDKGSETRDKLASYLESKGIKLSREELDELISVVKEKFRKESQAPGEEPSIEPVAE